MSHSYPLKNLPAPLQSLIKPMLFISLGLHALLLLVPVSSNEENPILAKEEAVKITQLPDASSKPSTTASKAPSKPSQPSRASSSSRPPSAVAPGSQGAETGQSSSVGDQSSTGDQSSNPFADFPHYPDAQPGCFGKQDCRQTAAKIQAVAGHFEQQLPAKKYTASPFANGADRKVYQVSKGGITQYLNLFMEAGGTVYVLGPKPLNKEDIKKSVAIPADVTIVIGELGRAASDTDFDDPSNFYAQYSRVDEGSLLVPTFKPDVSDDVTPTIVSQTADQVKNNLESKLNSKGLKLSQVGTYGGGILFELQKGNATAGYVNLVPAKSRNETIIVVWDNVPN